MKLISFLIATSVACSSFVHGQQTASPNFEFVGNGWCLDSQNTVFSWITLPGFPFANNCSDFCLQNPNYLRGFTYRSGDGRCYCHYEASQLPSPPAGSGSVVHTGTGAVDRASFDPDRQCYRYPIETSSPVTASPTTMPPTASPTTIPSFQFVGNGFCVDSQFRFHSYISSPSDAFSTVYSCNAWCLQSPDNLRGFSYDTNDERCFCLYEVSQLPDPLPAGTASVINNPGSGPITTTVGQLQSLECYTYDIETPISVETASPTTIPPTTSPTTNPTFQFFGIGYCLDSQYSLYSWFTLPGLPDPNACSDLCLQYPDYLHGFTYNNDGDGMCYCHYEVDQVPFPRPSESNVFFIGGRGPVASSSSVLGSGSGGQTLECYVYLEPTPSPSVNEIQSTYPSQSPSYQPTTTLSEVPSTQPSSHPSLRPSTNPTQAPSSSPSSSPSNTPTDSPTHMPTKVPTLSPLFEPEDPGLRSSPPVTVGPTTTAPSSQPMTSGPTSCYSGKASKNAKNAKVTDESSKSSKSNYPCNGKSSKSESYSGKSSKSNYSSSGYTSSKSLKENSVQGYSLRY